MAVRMLRALVWLLSACAACAFLFLAIRRLLYPLELDPVEGVLMEHAARLAERRSVYVEPSLRFVALPIMPGFPALISLPAQLIDGQLWQPRLVSLLSILGSVAIMARIVRAETESWTLGIASAGLALAAYDAVGGQFDVGRPDALAMFLVFAGFAALRFRTGAWGTLGAAAALSAAFLVQQQAAWFVAAALVLLAVERRRMLVFCLGVALIGGAGHALLSWWLGPWFNFYAWDVPLHELRLDPGALLQYVRGLLLGTLGPLSLAALLSLALPRRTLHGVDGPWILMAGAALGAGIVGASTPGSGPAAAIPTVLALALLGPIAMHRVTRHLSAWPGSTVLAGAQVGLTAILLQFLLLSYDVRPYLPPERSAQALRSFREWVRDQVRPVLVLDHGFHVRAEGREPGASLLALDHLARSNAGGMIERDPHALDRLVWALRSGPERPILATDRPLAECGLLKPLAAAYRPERHRRFEVTRPAASRYPGLPEYAHVPD